MFVFSDLKKCPGRAGCWSIGKCGISSASDIKRCDSRLTASGQVSLPGPSYSEAAPMNGLAAAQPYNIQQVLPVAGLQQTNPPAPQYW